MRVFLKLRILLDFHVSRHFLKSFSVHNDNNIIDTLYFAVSVHLK